MEYHKDDIDFCAERDLEFHNALLKASGNKEEARSAMLEHLEMAEDDILRLETIK